MDSILQYHAIPDPSKSALKRGFHIVSGGQVYHSDKNGEN
jgi:hypothetical protein